jgi:hypothetical protein
MFAQENKMHHLRNRFKNNILILTKTMKQVLTINGYYDINLVTKGIGNLIKATLIPRNWYCNNVEDNEGILKNVRGGQNRINL